MIISSNAGRIGEWLQVDLRSPTLVTGIITQGSGLYNEWVKSFTIASGNSTSSLTTIQNKNGDKVFCFKKNEDKTVDNIIFAIASKNNLFQTQTR